MRYKNQRKGIGLQRAILVIIGMCFSVGAWSADRQAEKRIIFDTTAMADLQNEYSSPEYFDDDLDNAQQWIAPSTTAAYRTYLKQGQDFGFSFLRYKARGYDNRVLREPYTVLENIEISDLWSLRPAWWSMGNFSSLSTRNFASPQYGLGFYGQSLDFDPRLMESGGRVSYSFSNRSTTHRLRAHYVLSERKGWSLAAALDAGFGRSLSIEGTGRNGGGLLLEASKQFGTKNRIRVILVGNPTQSDGRMASTREAFALTSNNLYNPAWGYQGSSVRSARVSRSGVATVILGHEVRLNDQMSLNTRLLSSFNQNSYSGLLWHDAPNPWPDYYRNMPSFESSPELRQELTRLWQSDPSVSQINYRGMYEFNAVTGSAASYIMERRVVESLRTGLSTTLCGTLGSGAAIGYDVTLRFDLQQDLNYKVVDDLFGAKYWVDLDNFVEQNDDVKEFTQSNAFTPNRRVTVGDEFGYKYSMQLTRTAVDAAFYGSHEQFIWNAWAGVEVPTYTRYGYYHKENFKLDDSFGRSATHTLIDHRVGGRIGYRRGGRAEIALALSHWSQAPRATNLFLSPRYRATIIPDPRNQQTTSVEVSGFYRVPGFSLSGAVYYTGVASGTQLTNFYDDLARFYCHYLMEDVARQYLGIEIGAQVEVYPRLWLMAMAAVSSNRYTENPRATEFVEATGATALTERVNLSGLHCGVSPEKIARLEVSYRPRGWTLNLAANAFGGNYIAVSPLRYTARATAAQSNPETWHPEQEKLTSALTLDLFAGKTFRLPAGQRIGVYAGVNNLLNNRSIEASGYQASRINLPSKYYYALGINGFLNVSIGF